jgi:arginine repressor
MPFEKGKATEGAGRKGYELEQAQLEKMRSILDKDLKIIERLQDAEEINPTDEKKLQISQSRVSKYLDKLHATKEHHQHEGNLIITIEKEVADKYNVNPITKNNN